MSSRLDMTLSDAMACAGLTKLPKEATDNLWMKAVVKVTKCDNSENYAIALNTINGKPSVIRDFGNMAKITSIDNIYPYYVMPKGAMPNLRNKQDIATYLSVMTDMTSDDVLQKLSRKKEDGTDKTEEEIKANKDEIEALVTRAAFEQEMKICSEYDKTTNVK